MIKQESEIIYKCVKDLEETKKMDPGVAMTPASVSKFKSGKGHQYKMTFTKKPNMPQEMVKD